MLSNIGIRKALDMKEIGISPLNENLMNPCSYDVTMGNTVRRVQRMSKMLDLCNFDYEYSIEVTADQFVVQPGEFILAVTREKLTLSENYCAEVWSKSSMGRLGQTATCGGAGWIDPGFSGYVTLEIVNLLPRPVIYTAGQRVAQIAFTRLDCVADPCYNANGQYQDQANVPVPANKIKF